MTTKKQSAIIAITVCALLYPWPLGAKERVVRPVQIQGQGTIVVSLIDSSYEATETGRATHTGRFSNEYSGYFNLKTFMFASAAGISTAASGDQLFWEELPDQPHVAFWRGGTGRFEGASGSFVYATADLNVSVDLDSMTLVITYSYAGSGTIAY